MISREAISLGGMETSQSARMLRTSPEAGVRSKGWTSLAIRLVNKSAVKTRFIAHSVAFKIRIGDEIFYVDEGGFAYLPSQVPHAFLNLTDEGGEIIVVYTPGGGHKFYEEMGPVSRAAGSDRKQIAALFEKYGMTLLGGPLTAD